MGSSKWGCLSAVVIGGVGLVLFALGFDSHTTEAMPFGAVLTAIGLFVGEMICLDEVPVNGAQLEL